MQKGRNWVDYKQIKSTITMEMVLKHYGVFDALNKVEGKNALGCCPIHQGSDPHQFSVCLTKNIWHCFGSCNTGGNVLDFVSMIEGGISIRNAALLLKKFTGSGGDNLATHDPTPPETKNDQSKPIITETKTGPSEPVINPPLSFTLKTLTTDHPFFTENGISQETVNYFGLGFCKKGLLKDRIVIPIHDHLGRLVAYCGRSINAEQEEQEGKYKMPKGFVRSALVFNLNRLEKNETPLLVVEDFFSAFKAHQYGFPKVIALMGSNIGKGQETAIFDHIGTSGRLLLLFSNTEYSQKCADECQALFSRQAYVKKLNPAPYAESPCHLTAEQFSALLS